jgi:oxygen-independent coproporphyrinogen-3 oxidase
MIVSLMTPTPQFANDLADVVRIFWGDAAFRVNESGGDVMIRHTESVQNGVRVCRMEMAGAYSGVMEKSRVVSKDSLLEKRYHKRLIKQTLFDALKAATGRTPPWGSLTGIRPTRLLYEAMDRGLSLEEAEKETREVFCVRDDKAALLREIVTVQQGMAQSAETDADLYVGIPFCVSRCAYCSFLSGEVGKGKELPPYVEAVVKEIEATLALMEEKGLKPRAFYMGGGTPTALSAKQL